MGKPCVEQDYIVEDITPHQCRLRDMTYVLSIAKFFTRQNEGEMSDHSNMKLHHTLSECNVGMR